MKIINGLISRLILKLEKKKLELIIKTKACRLRRAILNHPSLIDDESVS
jgi:hypothetical protein